MGPFARSLRSHFEPSARHRGEFMTEDVTLVSEEGPPWLAMVQGTHIYSVSVGGDQMMCSCPAFSSFGPCKHLWATICVVDELLGDLGEVVAASASAEKGAGTTTGRKKAKGQRQMVERIAMMRGNERLERLRWQRRDRVVPVLQRMAEQLHYFLHPVRSRGGNVVLTLARRRRLGNGRWSVPKPVDLWNVGQATFADALDRRMLDRLDPAAQLAMDRHVMAQVPRDAVLEVLGELAAQRRLFLCEATSVSGARENDLPRIEVTPDESVPVEIEVRSPKRGPTVVEARVVHGEGAPFRCVVGTDAALLGQRVVRLRTDADHALVADLLTEGALTVSPDQQVQVQALVSPPEPATLALVGCQVRFVEGVVLEGKGPGAAADLVFEYGLADVEDGSDGPLAEVRAAEATADVDVGGRRGPRLMDAEMEWVDWALDAGASCRTERGETNLEVPRARIVDFVGACLDRGVAVMVEGRAVRSMATPSLRVESGIDWFDVELGTRGEAGASLPDILRAVKKRQRFVRLPSGALAMIGGEAVAGLAELASVGKIQGDKIRFGRNQGFLLDAMLASRGDTVDVDETFAALRQRCRSGLTPKPKDAPKGFGATLRPYQREGLGWFRFLGELGVGGCLADDMGLGKTVQVLALLEQQRRRRPKPRPSLVVAPRSLVFHWQREAEAFAPKLEVVVFVGTGRFEQHAALVEKDFAGVDVVLTTYGTWRNDVAQLDKVSWNYVVLDEAQAIKNERSQVSKAVRLCRSEHRVALSGTPVENHLGELWSLFEFLNPGMLGASKTFRDLVRSGANAVGGGSEEEAADGRASFLASLRAAVRPFMLRRTKEQVLDDLPEKTIQVIDCEMPPRQRKAYNELAEHYRAALLGELDGDLAQEQRFMVLEALLRLRQASCHPGLLDEARADEACAKFEALLPMLEELREEGHKALVFSQFPSFLTLLRRHLDEQKIDYAYLDGRTRKRQQVVDRFQTDPDCGLFLISIKAGGHGLNLTAASYVFLLDPWWNPAVEAQAIDRAHRIGQQSHVHAFRLICRDSVEERVAELQQRKRSVAEAVLGDDASILQELTAEDVAALLATR